MSSRCGTKCGPSTPVPFHGNTPSPGTACCAARSVVHVVMGRWATAYAALQSVVVATANRAGGGQGGTCLPHRGRWWCGKCSYGQNTPQVNASHGRDVATPACRRNCVRYVRASPAVPRHGATVQRLLFPLYRQLQKRPPGARRRYSDASALPVMSVVCSLARRWWNYLYRGHHGIGNGAAVCWRVCFTHQPDVPTETRQRHRTRLERKPREKIGKMPARSGARRVPQQGRCRRCAACAMAPRGRHEGVVARYGKTCGVRCAVVPRGLQCGGRYKRAVKKAC